MQDSRIRSIPVYYYYVLLLLGILTLFSFFYPRQILRMSEEYHRHILQNHIQAIELKAFREGAEGVELTGRIWEAISPYPDVLLLRCDSTWNSKLQHLDSSLLAQVSADRSQYLKLASQEIFFFPHQLSGHNVASGSLMIGLDASNIRQPYHTALQEVAILALITLSLVFGFLWVQHNRNSKIRKLKQYTSDAFIDGLSEFNSFESQTILIKNLHRQAIENHLFNLSIVLEKQGQELVFHSYRSRTRLPARSEHYISRLSIPYDSIPVSPLGSTPALLLPDIIILPGKQPTQFAYIRIFRNLLWMVSFAPGEMHFDENDLRFLSMVPRIIDPVMNRQSRLDKIEKYLQNTLAELKTTRAMMIHLTEQRARLKEIINHDLKAPINNVLGLIDSINRKYASRLAMDIPDRLRRIEENARKQHEKVDELLTVFKDLSERNSFHLMTPVTLLETVQQNLSELSESKNALIEFEKPMQPVFTDSAQCELLFYMILRLYIKLVSYEWGRSIIRIEQNMFEEMTAFKFLLNLEEKPADHEQMTTFYRHFEKNPNYMLIQEIVRSLGVKTWIDWDAQLPAFNLGFEKNQYMD